MKKNITAIVLIFAMLVSFAACKKLPQDNEFVVESQVYVVDDEGVTRDVQVEYNEQGTEVYYYEDYDGNKVTVANKDVVVQTTKVRKTTTTSIFENADLTPEEESLLNTFNDPEAFDTLIDETLTEPELEISDEPIPEDNFEEIKVELDPEGNPQHDDVEKRYTDIINSGKFTMDFVVKSNNNGQEMIVPVNVVRDGTSMYFETAMPVNGEGSMKLAFILRDETCYLIIPGMRAYMTVPAEDMGQLFNTDIIESDGNATYISTNEVEFNGQKYICDVYESEGATIKYYYNSKEIKRIESVDANGNTTIMEINEVSGNANASKFKVPSGYIDMTKLMGNSFDFSGLASAQ